VLFYGSDPLYGICLFCCQSHSLMLHTLPLALTARGPPPPVRAVRPALQGPRQPGARPGRRPPHPRRAGGRQVCPPGHSHGSCLRSRHPLRRPLPPAPPRRPLPRRAAARAPLFSAGPPPPDLSLVPHGVPGPLPRRLPPPRGQERADGHHRRPHRAPHPHRVPRGGGDRRYENSSCPHSFFCA
jgi:hypothetical protein